MTVKELSKYFETVAPTRDFPTPVGAQRIILLNPLFNFSSISDMISFCIVLGENGVGNFSKRDRINPLFL